MNKKSLLIGAIAGGLVISCVVIAVVVVLNFFAVADTYEKIQAVLQEPVLEPTLMPTSIPQVSENYMDETFKGMLMLREGLWDMQKQTSLVATNSLIFFDEGWQTKVRDAIDKQIQGMEIISALTPPENAIPMHQKLLQSFEELKLTHELLIDGLGTNNSTSIVEAALHISKFSEIFVEAVELSPEGTLADPDADFYDRLNRGLSLINDGFTEMKSQTSLTLPNSAIWYDENWKAQVRRAIDKQVDGMEIISTLVPPLVAIPMHSKMLQSFVELRLFHEFLIDGMLNDDPDSIEKANQHRVKFAEIIMEAGDLAPTK